MSEKEYIVSLHRNVDYEAFNREMIASTGSGAIPNRSAPVANARPGSKRNTHYMLTDEEAASLTMDPRVAGVEIPVSKRDDIQITPFATQDGDFTKTDSSRGFFINWGLRRVNEATNPYTENTVSGGYNYTLDGSGVDIVIQDTGIQADHPEWEDSTGTSRLRQIDWYTASGLPGSMPTEHYTDYHGHGTHVGATAAGKTYGFAKNARVYAVKVDGLEGDEDPNGGIPVEDCFDVIKEWHNNKEVDPTTGVKRPTIVNMSWGYSKLWTSISEITYRGVSYTGTAIDTESERWQLGLVPLTSNGFYRSPVRIASVDTDIEEMIDAGIHVVIASGNSYAKIDIEGGLDYDNEAVTNGGTFFYHRGSSPYSIEAHMTGNVDSSIHSGGLEQKSVSSNAGPGVSIWAPGTDIMSAASTINIFEDDGPYPLDTDYKISNISGTSMAAPQVAGVLGLFMQLNPGATPAQAKAFLENNAQADQLYTTGQANDYTNTRSLWGGNNSFLYNKFNSATQLTLGSQSTQAVQAVPTYSLSASASSVNEGSSVDITLTTTNVADGTSISYTISGIESGDISQSLTGSFTVSSNTASVTISTIADTTTEGEQTMTLSLVGVSESVDILINDTSLTPPSPTYTVTPAANNIDEGSALTINVTTTNVADATTLYWTVTSPSDWNVDSGSFVISSNAGSFTVTPAADALTEGAENFTVNIRTGSIAGTVVATSSSITINDISTTPSGTVYNVTVASGTNQYGTGNKYYIDGFTGASPTVNLTEGQTYVFRQSDTSNATHQLLFSTTANGTWGGGVEYTEGVTKVGTAGQLGAYTQITVATAAPQLYYYCINHSGMGGTANTPSAGASVYDSLTSTATADEGDTVVFTVNTQNVEDGTTVGYTITGIDAGDLSAGSLTGSITINSNSGTASVTLDNDLTTEGSETMTMTLDATDSAGDSTNALTSQTEISDTSTQPAATYAVSPAANNVNEGSALTFTVTTTNVSDGTTLYWTVSNDGDFGTASGSFTVNSNTGTFDVTPTADTTTEGAEVFAASVRTSSIAGTVVATSSNVTINDTSTTPAFSPDYTITVTNNGASDYVMSGSDRNGSVSGNDPTLNFQNGDKVRFSVNAAGHPFYVKTAQVGGTSNQASGVDGNGSQSGNVDWTVGSTGTFYYICQFHSGMSNSITVS